MSHTGCPQDIIMSSGFGWIPGRGSGPGLQAVAERIRETLDQGLDRSLKLAVTGLRSSGKTAFITSLVNQLQHCGDDGKQPLFSSHIVGTRQVEQGNPRVRPFPYREGLRSLSGSAPEWPESTRGMSELRLAIRYRPRHWLQRKLNDFRTLNLDIVDYPGEWLLDLPLLETSFYEWSRHSAELLSRSPRRELAAPWKTAVGYQDPFAPVDGDTLDRLSRMYADFLYQCKEDRTGLSIIQPGRFVLPGELEGTPVLSFFPFISVDDYGEEQLRSAPRDSLYRKLSERFEYYKEHVVKVFYGDYFSRFDRQIVLVDCLKTLNRGSESFRDTEEALGLLLSNFSYGRSGFLKRIFKPSIDRVLFAATKADHVTPNQLHNLELFLDRLVLESKRKIQFEGIETRCMALASVRATEPVNAMFQGRQISCIRGRKKGTHESVALFPGEVPTSLPSLDSWGEERFNFIDFSPPQLGDVVQHPLPHINMDEAFQFLVEDVFA